VDDGSTDRSGEILRDIVQRHPNMRYVAFSRNFGHEAATTAGVDHAEGDAVVIMDADLQDPPEVVPDLVAKWREGYHVVYAKRARRKGESAWKRATSWLFYRMLRRIGEIDIPADTGDFRLMDQRVARQFRRCREQSRFVRGLVAWAGYKQTAVEYERDERHAGDTKYGFFRLLWLALDACVGFSAAPLRLSSFLGFIVCLFSLIMAAVIVVQKIVWGIPIPGYALLAVGMFMLGGVQLAVIGLLGEYVARIYRQTQARPLYLIGEKSADLPAGEEGLASTFVGDSGRGRE